MTPLQTLSLVLLALVLALAIWRRINIGVLALGATFVLVLVGGLDPDEVYEEFPGSIFVLLIGVSLLFGHLQRSGVLGWFVNQVYRLIGDRTALIPWAGFAIAGLLSTLGAFSTAPIAILVPTIAHLSRRFPKSFLISELAVVVGANSAGLSPLNPSGSVIKKVAHQYGVSYQPWLIWAMSILLAILTVTALQAFLARRANQAQAGTASDRRSPIDYQPFTRPLQVVEGDEHHIVRPAYAICSALGLLAFVLLVVLAKTDVGLTAMVLVVLLQLAFRPEEKKLFTAVPWPSVLLLCGLLTYLGALQEVGTMKSIQNVLQANTSAVLLVFILAYMTAVLCNIESSTLGVLGLVMPLVFAAFSTNPALSWILVACAAPATLMVMNPIHVSGTLIMAYSDERDQPALFRSLLGISVTITAIAPGLLCLVPALMM